MNIVLLQVKKRYIMLNVLYDDTLFFYGKAHISISECVYKLSSFSVSFGVGWGEVDEAAYLNEGESEYS